MSFALPEALFFTGIDWAAETHAVCVMDAGGKIVAEFTIEHSADGIALLIGRLARYGTPGGMPVAIERPNGRLAGLLLEAAAARRSAYVVLFRREAARRTPVPASCRCYPLSRSDALRAGCFRGRQVLGGRPGRPPLSLRRQGGPRSRLVDWRRLRESDRQVRESGFRPSRFQA